jgi:hypothetical protein
MSELALDEDPQGSFAIYLSGFVMFYCMGGAYSVCWLLPEPRVPPKTTGKTLLFCFSLGCIGSMSAPLIAVMGMWEATLSNIICFVVTIVLVSLLPAPGKYSTSMDAQQEKIVG